MAVWCVGKAAVNCLLATSLLGFGSMLMLGSSPCPAADSLSQPQRGRVQTESPSAPPSPSPDDKEKEDDDTRRRGDDQDGNNNTQAGFVLRPTGRYAHRAAYIQRAAEAAGWAVASLERRSPLRMNAGKRIWGNLVVLRRV